MFLTMALIVCCASVFIEVKLVNSVPFLEKIYTQGFMGIPGAWVNNICSLGISAVFGLVFQAQGISIFVGGMASIPVSNIYFSSKYQLNERGVTLKSVKDGLTTKTVEVGEWWSVNAHYFTDLAKTIMVIIKIITFPVRALAKTNSAAHQGTGKIIEITGRAKQRELVASVDNRLKSNEFYCQMRQRWEVRKAA